MAISINVVLEFRFYKGPDGTIYTDSSFEYAFWRRYLMVFSSVTIIARAKETKVEEIKQYWKVVTGDGVDFKPIPFYHGLVDMIKRLPFIIRSIKKISNESGPVYLFRIPSFISALFFIVNRKMIRRAYGVEMVGDPEEVFGALPQAYQIIGKPFIKLTKDIIKNAVAVSYVERIILPFKYLSKSSDKAFFISDIILPDEDIQIDPKTFFSANQDLSIITIGSLEQMYKAPDVVFKALAILKEQGFMFNLTWVGGGIYEEKMKLLAISLGIQKQVVFMGTVTDRKVINKCFEAADLFLLASRTEGLPRVILEAMSKAVPCIGTRVGGIPELIPSQYLFEKDNIQQLVQLLKRLSLDKDELRQMSNYSLSKVKAYTNKALDVERKRFYSTIFEHNL